MQKRLLTGKHLWQGNEACAEGALAAGLSLFAGYPITPATEISERLSSRLPAVGGTFVQGADELDSLTILIGAVWGGAKGMTATSGNGICLMQENLGYACITETPLVVVDCQRAGPATGAATKTMQGDFYTVRYGSNADYAIIALAPDSPQEMFDLTVEAFNLSERYRVPTFVMADEIIAHMRERVLVPEGIDIVPRCKPTVSSENFVPWRAQPETQVPEMAHFGEGYRMPVPGLTHDEYGRPSASYNVHSAMVQRLVNKVETAAEQLTRYESLFLDDAEIVLIAYGSVARSAKRAVTLLREQGVKAGLLRLISLWPFPDALLRRATGKARRALVIEMSVGKLVREVERALAGSVPTSLLSKPGISLPTPQEIISFVREAP
jgi:2-oxoglutarate ferredoxin oxidoreductase subunit alpha